jgi:hypothetical protein
MKNHVLNAMGVLALGIGLGGCEEEKKPETAAPPAVSALQAAEPVPSAAEPEERPSRPETIEMDLTDERRAKLTKAYADAQGFTLAKDLEEQLKKNKTLKDEQKAVKAFDAKAKNKWLLFTGTMVNLTKDGFDMAVVYTPQLPNDPMGMSRQFFTVTFSNVQGYDESKFKVGSAGVVLAKYTGDKKASPAYEVVEAGHWQ